jgi:hypothetical protein
MDVYMARNADAYTTQAAIMAGSVKRRSRDYKESLSSYQQELRSYQLSKEEYQRRLQSYKERYDPYLKSSRGGVAFKRKLAPRTLQRVGAGYTQESQSLQAKQKALVAKQKELVARRIALIKESKDIQFQQQKFEQTFRGVTITTTEQGGTELKVGGSTYYLDPKDKLIGVKDPIRRELRKATPSDALHYKLVVEPVYERMQSMPGKIKETTISPEYLKKEEYYKKVPEARGTVTRFEEKPFFQRQKERIKQEFIQYKLGGVREQERISTKYFEAGVRGASIAILSTSPVGLSVGITGVGIAAGVGSFVAGKELIETAQVPTRREYAGKKYKDLPLKQKGMKAIASPIVSDIGASIFTGGVTFASSKASAWETSLSFGKYSEISPGYAGVTGKAASKVKYPVTGKEAFVKSRFTGYSLAKQQGKSTLSVQDLKFVSWVGKTSPKSIKQVMKVKQAAVIKPTGIKDFFGAGWTAKVSKPTTIKSPKIVSKVTKRTVHPYQFAQAEIKAGRLKEVRIVQSLGKGTKEYSAFYQGPSFKSPKPSIVMKKRLFRHPDEATEVMAHELFHHVSPIRGTKLDVRAVPYHFRPEERLAYARQWIFYKGKGKLPGGKFTVPETVTKVKGLLKPTKEVLATSKVKYFGGRTFIQKDYIVSKEGVEQTWFRSMGVSRQFKWKEITQQVKVKGQPKLQFGFGVYERQIPQTSAKFVTSQATKVVTKPSPPVMSIAPKVIRSVQKPLLPKVVPTKGTYLAPAAGISPSIIRQTGRYLASSPYAGTGQYELQMGAAPLITGLSIATPKREIRTRVATMIDVGYKSALKVKQEQKPITRMRVSQLVSITPAIRTRTGIATKPRIDQRIRQDTKITTRTRTGTKLRMGQPTPTTPPPGFGWGFLPPAMKVPKLGKFKKAKTSLKKSQRKQSYKPSIFATTLPSIKFKPMKKFTGFEVRRVRKRRKNK